MRIGSAMNSGLSGLAAATAALDASAVNIANASDPGAVRVSISQGARDLQAGGEVDLAREIVGQSIASIAYRANLKTIQTADELTQTLMALGAP